MRTHSDSQHPVPHDANANIATAIYAFSTHSRCISKQRNKPTYWLTSEQTPLLTAERSHEHRLTIFTLAGSLPSCHFQLYVLSGVEGCYVQVNLLLFHIWFIYFHCALICLTVRDDLWVKNPHPRNPILISFHFFFLFILRFLHCHFPFPFLLWDFKFSRRRVWCSELSSWLYCRVNSFLSAFSALFFYVFFFYLFPSYFLCPFSLSRTVFLYSFAFPVRSFSYFSSHSSNYRVFAEWHSSFPDRDQNVFKTSYSLPEMHRRLSVYNARQINRDEKHLFLGRRRGRFCRANLRH
jgi:hypothetical protein